MSNEHVVTLMNKYMELKMQLASIEADKKKLIDEAMPKEVRQRIAEIEDEFAGKNEKAQKDLAELEEAIKIGVVGLKQTLVVKGLKASYHPGRVTWDAKGLEGVVKNHPDLAPILLPLKKQGNDYASFRFDEK